LIKRGWLENTVCLVSMIFPSDKLNLHLVKTQQPAMFDDNGLGRNDVENSERK